MNIQELRIGNLVNFTFMELIEQYTVYEIRQDKILITDDISYQPSMVSGIPLTEEWLLKMGFVSEPRGYCIYLYPWSLVLNSNVDIEGDVFWHQPDYSWHTHNFVGRIYYAHQLMNLYYSLTGQELTINNPN